MNDNNKAVTWKHAIILSDLMQRISGHGCQIEPLSNGLYLVYRTDPYNIRKYLV